MKGTIINYDHQSTEVLNPRVVGEFPVTVQGMSSLTVCRTTPLTVDGSRSPGMFQDQSQLVAHEQVE